MYKMFYMASAFNGDVSRWDVSSVTDMQDMFAGASAFNQNLHSWTLPDDAVTIDIFLYAAHMCAKGQWSNGRRQYWPPLVSARGRREAGCY